MTSIEAPGGEQGNRLGFRAGQIEVPDDFDRMGEETITDLFEAHDGSAP